MQKRWTTLITPQTDRLPEIQVKSEECACRHHRYLDKKDEVNTYHVLCQQVTRQDNIMSSCICRMDPEVLGYGMHIDSSD